MKLILDKTLRLRTYLHDFENGFIYVENRENNTLKDCFFAFKGDVFPDGTLRTGKRKFFYSKESGEEIKKEVFTPDLARFEFFDKLYYVNLSGEITRIDGKPAKDCEYQFCAESVWHFARLGYASHAQIKSKWQTSNYSLTSVASALH